MRRILGPVLVGLGCFFLAVALLVRFYAYPELAVAPVNQNSVTKLQAEDATYFNTATLSEEQTDLSVQNLTLGDAEATEEAGDDVRVWFGSTSIRADDGTIISRSQERVAFGANDGAAINCCDAFTETTEGERTAANREGQVYKLPFNTQKKTYDWWDNTLGEPVDMKFVEETDVDGLRVYKFQSNVPRTQVGTREVPGSIVGSDEPAVVVNTMYENTKTLWVEPETGAIVDRNESTSTTLEYEGEDAVTATEADLEYTDETVAKNVKDLGDKGRQLGLARTTGPIVLGILGLLLLVAGILLSRRRRSDQYA
jgi:LPXTG-motif cell wall-anchored protein